MDERKYVISWKNRAWTLPIQSTVAYWLLIDRLNPPEIWWGVFYALMVIIWATAIANMIEQKEVDISDFLKRFPRAK